MDRSARLAWTTDHELWSLIRQAWPARQGIHQLGLWPLESGNLLAGLDGFHYDRTLVMQMSPHYLVQLQKHGAQRSEDWHSRVEETSSWMVKFGFTSYSLDSFHPMSWCPAHFFSMAVCDMCLQLGRSPVQMTWMPVVVWNSRPQRVPTGPNSELWIKLSKKRRKKLLTIQNTDRWLLCQNDFSKISQSET